MMKKKLLAIILAALSVSAAVTGCGSKPAQNSQSSSSQTSESETVQSSDATVTADSFGGRNDIAYVMIYNPDIYDEYKEPINKKLTTGDIKDNIDPSADRAEAPAQEISSKTLAQKNLKDIVGDKDITAMEGDRAPGLIPKYSKGDTHQFYHEEKADTFECISTGENCNVWCVKGSGTENALSEEIGKEFDAKIYPKDVAMFGEPRYADDGGKVEILFHPMSDNGIMGYFMPAELFTTLEAAYIGLPATGVTYDHAIIHINSALLGTSEQQKKDVYSTLAHEFQHMICTSDMFLGISGKFSNTWLNEAMSGYAEEDQYPGAQTDAMHDVSFIISDSIRYGQSIYNFDTDNGDYGPYGNVYLFSNYLVGLCGNDIFNKIHEVYRNDVYKNIDDAYAIHKSVPTAIAQDIDSKYDISIPGASSDDIWLSKLVLDFYINIASKGSDSFEDLRTTYLLYDKITPAEIEGGGRVLIATKEGTFDIPADADSPLVYVAFDKNFQPLDTIIK